MTRIALIMVLIGFVLGFHHSVAPHNVTLRSTSSDRAVPPETPALEPGFGKPPLYFIPNHGQVDERALFYAQASRYTLWMTKGGLVFDSVGNIDGTGKMDSRDVSRLSFLDANPDPQIKAIQPAEHRVNYLIGDAPSKWLTDIPTSQAVIYEDLYRRVDLKVYGLEEELEYDWVVRPGGRIDSIRFEYEKVNAVDIDREGNLSIATQCGAMIHRRPVCYQMRNGGKVSIEASFHRIKGNIFGFTVRDYDRSLPLIIDPVIVYSTYLGGSSSEYGFGIVVDATGAAYVAGDTYSKDFPVVNGIGDPAPLSTLRHGFVTKFSPAGNALIYSSYIGGSVGYSRCYNIALSDSGTVSLTGETSAYDFPQVNEFDTFMDGGNEAFVCKLNAAGNGFVFSTFLGGQSYDFGYGIAADGKGNVYVAGETRSSDFPHKNAFDGTLDGSADAFVSKFGAAGNLIYSTLLGGRYADTAAAIAVDGTGAAYVTGSTGSEDFPVKRAFDSTFGGRGPMYFWEDGFLAKLSPSGKSLVFSTFLGGTEDDDGLDIAVDPAKAIYVIGVTRATDFPVKDAYSAALNGSADLFVAKFASSGKALTYSTYLGGSGSEGSTYFEQGCGMAIDGTGAVYVTGETSSKDFPKLNPVDATYGGYGEAFVTKLSPAGNLLVYSTYLGGSDNDEGLDIAVDRNGAAYVTGDTTSINFPIKNAADSTKTGDNDAFVTKIK